MDARTSKGKPGSRFINPSDGSLHLLHDVASVDDALGPGAEVFVVDCVVRGGDEDEVEGTHSRFVPSDGFGASPVRVFAGWADDGDEGVVIRNVGSALFEHVEKDVAGGFTIV